MAKSGSSAAALVGQGRSVGSPSSHQQVVLDSSSQKLEGLSVKTIVEAIPWRFAGSRADTVYVAGAFFLSVQPARSWTWSADPTPTSDVECCRIIHIPSSVSASRLSDVWPPPGHPEPGVAGAHNLIRSERLLIFRPLIGRWHAGAQSKVMLGQSCKRMSRSRLQERGPL